jgi:hypothetical protein
MDGWIKPVLLGGTIGTLFVLLISAASIMAGASANEQPIAQVIKAAGDQLFPPSIGELLKLGDDEFLIKAEPGVSLTPTATSSIRKIEYGSSRTVTVSTTASGVYSSDGLASPHFRYPGIEVLQTPAERTAAALAHEDTLARWLPGRGWVATPTVSANSFVIVTRDGASTVINGSKGSCVIGRSIAVCN